MSVRPRAEWIRATWRWLAHGPHGVSEVRVIRPGQCGIGYFNEEDAFVQECLRVNVEANVYVGIQPRPLRLFARAPNVVRPIRRGARSHDIEVVTGTVIDLDPVRAPGEAATDGELAETLAVARELAGWCEQEGLMPPRLMMSGNGAQLWFATPPVALRPETRAQVLLGLRMFEAQVRAKVSSPRVQVDATHDAARIIKVMGTVSFKGGGTAERPHRVSQPLSPFDRQEDPALVARMTALAAMSAPPTDASSPVPAVAVVGRHRTAGAKRASLPVSSGAPTDTAEQLDLCWPARRLWEDGVQDRSVGIFLLVRYLAYKGLSLERLTELVLAFDRRVLGKLERRDGAEYVRHAWEKVRATRRPDGTIAPPCHALQKLGLCPVNRDVRARCDDYNLLFDLGAAVDGLPRSPFQAARKLLPVLEVLAHKDAPTQAKHLKVLAWHCSIHKPVLRRWLLRVMQAVPAVEESTADL